MPVSIKDIPLHSNPLSVISSDISLTVLTFGLSALKQASLTDHSVSRLCVSVAYSLSASLTHILFISLGLTSRFFNVNSDWKTAHRTDCIVAGMTERYITSIAQRLPAAVTSYSDFVLINTQKVGRRAPCGEIRGKRAFLSSSKRILETRSRFCGQRKFISRSYCSLVSSFIFIKSVSAITLRVSSDRLQYLRTVS